MLRLLGHGNGLHSHAAASPLIPASAALRLEGLHLRILAFAVSITATACSRSRLLSWLGNSPHPQSVACMAAACIRTQLHPAHPCKRCTPALKGFVCAALLRCSWHGNSLHSQSAAPAQHDSAALRLEGLRLRSIAFACTSTATACIRSRLLAWQQPAFARSCIPLIPASAALRLEGLRLRNQCFRCHYLGNNLHPHRYTPPLKGFVYAAVPGSLGMATACIRSRLLAWQQPAFARSCTRSSLQALHTSPEGLRLRCSASLFIARQQPAFAAGCSHGTAPACIRTQLHPAHHCKRCTPP